MSRITKLIYILLILFVLFSSFSLVLATEEDVAIDDLSAEPIVDVTTPTRDNIVQESSTDPSSLSTFSPSTVTSVSSLDNYAQANLSMSNVLSIILISIGVLLILFAIAILIRLKSER